MGAMLQGLLAALCLFSSQAVSPREGVQASPPLQGFRLNGSRYEPIVADAAGRLSSETLGLWLAVEDGRLRFVDPATGKPLLRIAEQIERADREAARAAAAETEIARLRALLEKK